MISADGTRTLSRVVKFTSGLPDNNGLTWKALLIAGDNSIDAFDNARKKVKEIILSRGVREENILQLSKKRNQLGSGVRMTSQANIKSSLEDLKVGPQDGCIVFMTSHGTRNGFFIKDEPSNMSPKAFASMLNATCGERPTVVLVLPATRGSSQTKKPCPLKIELF